MLQETYISDDACKITTCFLIGRNKTIIAVRININSQGNNLTDYGQT